MYNTEFINEEQRLDTTLGVVRQNIEELNMRRVNMNGLIDSTVANSILKSLSNKRKELTKAIDNPYFARVDFKSDEIGIIEQLYIGKTSVMNGNDSIVLDWRAPISSLYYEGKIGEASYICPDGKIIGEISLKRQYSIKEGKLLSYFEEDDISARDEILKKCLSESSDARLKNIIATIQAEQNQVIRQGIDMPIIVQGVAGSGKTTVALHRIAYLIYTYSNMLRADKIVIIAPNRFFLDYISDTLPDLGVDEIVQETYEDFCIKILERDLTVASANEELLKIVEKTNGFEVIKKVLQFKSSLQFKDIVEKYIADYEASIMNLLENDFIVCNQITINASSLQSTFQDSTGRLSLADRIIRLKNWMINIVKEVCAEYEYGYSTRGLNLSWDLYKELKENGKKNVEKFISHFRLGNVMIHMKNIIGNYTLFEEFLSHKEYKWMKDDFNKKIRDKKVSYEDLPALILIQHRLFGIKSEYLPGYVVVDEAQDLGPFHVYALNKITKNSAITILGDIAQGFYSYRGITDWNIVNSSVFDGKAKVIDLVQSYRTTVEVMNEANKVISKVKEQLHIQLANCVIRHGETVAYRKSNSLIDDIIKQINKLASNHKNIALITKNSEEAKQIFDLISQNFSDVNLLNDESKNFIAGISVLPVYLAKGLEFDSVIIVDASIAKYTDEILDGKLLYVAMTRAMSTLDIYYQGELTKWLV